MAWDCTADWEEVDVAGDDFSRGDAPDELESIYVDQFMVDTWHIGG
jgi:hypothetical protein